MSRLSKTVLAVSILLTVGVMVIGFWSSWSNLSAAAAAHGWHYPWHLPAELDLGCVAFVLLDQLAVTVHRRSRWLHAAAWAFAGASVWANAAVSDGSATWRVIYAAAPAAWVLGVEAIRFFLRAAQQPEAPADVLPWRRWLAAPKSTFRIRQRMLALNITYQHALWVRQAVMLAADLVNTDPGWQNAPALLRAQIRAWEVPAAVHAVIRDAAEAGSVPDFEAAVSGWITAALTAAERHSQSLARARFEATAGPAGEATSGTPSETAPEAPSSGPAGTAPKPAREARPKAAPAAAADYSRAPSKTAVRKMTGADLAPYVRCWVENGGTPTIAAVHRRFHVGDAKAREALQAAGLRDGDASAVVIQLDREAAR